MNEINTKLAKILTKDIDDFVNKEDGLKTQELVGTVGKIFIETILQNKEFSSNIPEELEFLTKASEVLNTMMWACSWGVLNKYASEKELVSAAVYFVDCLVVRVMSQGEIDLSIKDASKQLLKEQLEIINRLSDSFRLEEVAKKTGINFNSLH